MEPSLLSVSPRPLFLANFLMATQEPVPLWAAVTHYEANWSLRGVSQSKLDPPRGPFQQPFLLSCPRFPWCVPSHPSFYFYASNSLLLSASPREARLVNFSPMPGRGTHSTPLLSMISLFGLNDVPKWSLSEGEGKGWNTWNVKSMHTMELSLYDSPGRGIWHYTFIGLLLLLRVSSLHPRSKVSLFYFLRLALSTVALSSLSPAWLCIARKLSLCHRPVEMTSPSVRISIRLESRLKFKSVENSPETSERWRLMRDWNPPLSLHDGKNKIERKRRAFLKSKSPIDWLSFFLFLQSGFSALFSS